MKTILSIILMAISAYLNYITSSNIFVVLFYAFMIFSVFFLFKESNYSIRYDGTYFLFYIGSNQIDKSKSKALLIERNLEMIEKESSL